MNGRETYELVGIRSFRISFQAICEEAICDDIDISNAVHSLILGHLHEAKNLKTTALDFVSNNLVRRFLIEQRVLDTNAGKQLS
jgi:hypothetical protein